MFSVLHQLLFDTFHDRFIFMVRLHIARISIVYRWRLIMQCLIDINTNTL